MSNTTTRIKFTAGHEDGQHIPGWHALSHDTEYTACGYAITEYEHDEKDADRGAITCQHCLGAIKWYHAIKL